MFSLDFVVLADLIVKVDERRRFHIQQSLHGRNVLEFLVYLDEVVVIHVSQFVRLIDEMQIKRFRSFFDAKDNSRPSSNLCY